MSLLLGVETSYSPYGIIIGKGQEVLFDSTTIEEFEESRDVAMMTQVGLKKIGATLQDISKIIVNGTRGNQFCAHGRSFCKQFGVFVKSSNL
jgi:tRNA A37 threonylcarbamoyladenosine modification protein TsaB